MRNDIPTTYWSFRLGWSILHLALVVVAAVAFFIWALTDNHGANALGAWSRWMSDIRNTLSGIIPYPWGG